MNLIIYTKQITNHSEILEYFKCRTDMTVYIAQTKETVLKYFQKLKEVEQLGIINITVPSDLGLVQYVKANYPSTKILVYASPIIRQSIEIIKDAEIEFIDISIEKLKKNSAKIIDSNKNNREIK